MNTLWEWFTNDFRQNKSHGQRPREIQNDGKHCKIASRVRSCRIWSLQLSQFFLAPVIYPLRIRGFTTANSAINQSELKLKTCKRWQGRGIKSFMANNDWFWLIPLFIGRNYIYSTLISKSNLHEDFEPIIILSKRKNHYIKHIITLQSHYESALQIQSV